MATYPAPKIESVFNPNNFPDKDALNETITIDPYNIYSIGVSPFKTVNVTDASKYYILPKDDTLLPVTKVTNSSDLFYYNNVLNNINVKYVGDSTVKLAHFNIIVNFSFSHAQTAFNFAVFKNPTFNDTTKEISTSYISQSLTTKYNYASGVSDSVSISFMDRPNSNDIYYLGVNSGNVSANHLIYITGFSWNVTI